MPRRIHPSHLGRAPQALRWRLHRLGAMVRGAGGDFAVEHSHFWCDTEDGVRIAGSQLGPARGETAIVLVHGFLGFRTKPAMRVLAEALARRWSVFALDLRGHGHSGGGCTGGDKEALDVHAVVRLARARGFSRVVTIGGSMGGIAVLREAAERKGSDAVVAISTPAQWGTDTKAVKRMTWLFLSPVGRALAARVFGTRIHVEWGEPLPPMDLVGSIAPIPLLIVHGENDHFFPAEQARLLFERAGEPKRLLLLPGFGHAEDGFTPGFAGTLEREIESLLAHAAV